MPHQLLQNKCNSIMSGLHQNTKKRRTAARSATVWRKMDHIQKNPRPCGFYVRIVTWPKISVKLLSCRHSKIHLNPYHSIRLPCNTLKVPAVISITAFLLFHSMKIFLPMSTFCIMYVHDAILLQVKISHFFH